MPAHQRPRRIARELALLSQSQLPKNPDKLAREDLEQMVLASVRTLAAEIDDALEMAASEVQRGHERLLASETRATDVRSARAMVSEALELTQRAINLLGETVELPEAIHIARSQAAVRDYAVEILATISRHRQEIDACLEEALVNWQLSRLPRIDRGILRIAVAEMVYLGFEERGAIDEAVELGKRYSDEDGYKFINGVLRRVSNRRRAGSQEPSSPSDRANLTEKPSEASPQSF